MKPSEQRKTILKTNQTTNQYELDIKELLKGLTYKDVVFLGVIIFIDKAKEKEKSVNNHKKP